MSTIDRINEWIDFLEKLLSDADKNNTIVEKLNKLYKQREAYHHQKRLNDAFYAEAARLVPLQTDRKTTSGALAASGRRARLLEPHYSLDAAHFRDMRAAS
mgnify:CR=1 FL=1